MTLTKKMRGKRNGQFRHSPLYGVHGNGTGGRRGFTYPYGGGFSGYRLGLHKQSRRQGAISNTRRSRVFSEDEW